jgi:hypothetical protein
MKRIKKSKGNRLLLIGIIVILLAIISLIVVSLFLGKKEEKIQYVAIDELIEPSDIIAYYSFDIDARDDSGNQNDGLVNGAKHVTSGQKVGSGAYEFDGLNDGILTPVAFPDKDFSITLWVKDYRDNVDSLRMVMSDVNHNFAIYRFLNGRFTWVTYPRNYNDEDPGAAIKIKPDIWYFIAVVHNERGGTNQIWVNAESYNYSSNSPVDNAGNFVIGNYYNTELWWNGTIDEVGIWGKTLTLAEIKKLYNRGNGYNPTK